MTEPAPAPESLEQAFASERRLLFGLCYRMTGSAADAEDIVQETFARALARPPARSDAPWRPWLVQVAVNLARDELRRRKRRSYCGPWLPEPVDDAELGLGAHEPAATTGRYELVESVSFAFLLALEALSPAQRAVLLLREVFEYSSAEAAAALDLSEANARVLLHRARRAMAEYDRARFVPDRAARERSLEVLTRFMALFARQDVAGMEKLLADDVVTYNDTDGRYRAAGIPVVGRSKVARFHAGIARLRAREQPRVSLRWMNGAPAVAVEFDAVTSGGLAPRFLTLGELDAQGLVRRIYTVLAPAKLRALSPSGTGSPSSPRRRRQARPRTA
jgi:RNA polymerase sigma-70 factor (ECF subfamily)